MACNSVKLSMICVNICVSGPQRHRCRLEADATMLGPNVPDFASFLSTAKEGLFGSEGARGAPGCS